VAVTVVVVVVVVVVKDGVEVAAGWMLTRQ